MTVYDPSWVQFTEILFIVLPSQINAIEILKIDIQHSFDRN